jgi:predicted outer membrane repeat protein
VFYVGSGAACTHATIQDAVNAGQVNGTGLDVIFVARNRTYTNQNILIQNDTLVLIGGTPDCTTNGSDPVNPTVISGAGGSALPVFRVQGDGNIEFRNLVVRDGDASNSADGGGLSVTAGPHQITLNGVRFENNHAGRGGAMSVSPGGLNSITVFIRGNTQFIANEADADGGAIYCRTSTITGTSRQLAFRSNLAARDGGGIYAENCDVSLYSEDTFGLFWNNQSGRNGGGILATGAISSTEIYSTSATSPTKLGVNSAMELGGAIHVRDGAELRVQGAVFYANLAADGGAIQATGSPGTSGTNVYMGPDAGIAGAVACPVGQFCNRFENNETWVASSGSAAVAHVLSSQGSGASGNLTLRGAYFSGNTGRHVVSGGAVSVVASDRTEVANAVFTGNTTFMPLILAPRLLVLFTSIGGNAIGTGPLIVANGGSCQVSFVAAYQPGLAAVGFGAATTLTTSFLIANDLGTIAPTTNNLWADPQFVSNTDLHLQPGSPAIDYGLGGLSAAYTVDAEGRPRPIDNPAVQNEFGPIDVGAFEMPATASELFHDGFENP